MAKKDLKPVHPGEVLLEEFLKPMSLSQNRLALDQLLTSCQQEKSTFACRLAASMKLSWGNGVLRRIRRCGLGAISRCRHSFGWVCKWITIWM